MDVSEAMHIVNSQVLVRGRSDEALIDRVRYMPEFRAPIKKLLRQLG